MRWQDMSFKLKMGIAFGFILVLMGLIGTITYFGIRKVEATGETATRASQLETLMAQREIDHLQWVRQVNDFLMRDGGQLTVQTDHQLCGLGKWLHGPQRAEAEAKFPKLIPLLKALEAPHHTVHQSAISIKAAASQGDDKKTAFAVYQDTTLPALEAVSKVLHDIETEVSATAQAALQEQTTTAESVHHTATTLSIIVKASITRPRRCPSSASSWASARRSSSHATASAVWLARWTLPASCPRATSPRPWP
jgi:hypothetical protein